MTTYTIKNEAGKTIAVMIKFDDGKCIVSHLQTTFDSLEEAGQHLNTKLTLQDSAYEARIF